MSFLKLFFTGALMFCIVTSAASAEPVSQLNPSHWQTYHNASMGFEVRYPDTWHVEINARGDHVALEQVSQSTKPPVTINLYIQRNINPQGLTAHQWLDNQNKGKTPPYKYIFRESAIGGLPAMYSEHIGSFGKLFQFFVPMNKTDIFRIGIIQLPSPDMEHLDPEYEAILSTLKFMD